ncbi:hypothetical protein V2J09_015020 [Rumex salicifolius]
MRNTARNRTETSNGSIRVGGPISQGVSSMVCRTANVTHTHNPEPILLLLVMPDADDVVVDPKENSSTLVVTDVNNPLWLHHTERSNLVLSTQLLNENNYYKWRRAVEVSLKAKSKMAFIFGAVPKPAVDSPTFPQWERCNSMVTSWFFHSVEKDIAESLLYFDSAAEIWKDLETRFGSPNSSRIFQVQKELFTVSQGNLSVSSYYTNFRRLWDEFVVLVEPPRCASCKTVGAVPPLFFTLQVVQFLVGLNETYSSVRTNVLMRTPMPLLGEDEQHRSLQSTSPLGSDSTALSASSKPNFASNPGRGASSGSRGASRGGGRGSDRRSSFFCDHCKTQGHTMDRCYKLHGYPNQRTDSKSSSNASFSGNSDYVKPVAQPCDSSSDESPSLTKEQYAQLLALLSKSEVGGSSSSKTGLMNGKPVSAPETPSDSTVSPVVPCPVVEAPRRSTRQLRAPGSVRKDKGLEETTSIIAEDATSSGNARISLGRSIHIRFDPVARESAWGGRDIRLCIIASFPSVP